MIFSSLFCRQRRALLSCLLLAFSGTPAYLAAAEFQGVMRDVIAGVGHVSSPERPLQPNGFLSPYQYLFQSPAPEGTGSYPLSSGFLIKPTGTFVTSFRAIDGAHHLEVTGTDKRRWRAKLIGADRALDLAVLKLEAGKGASPGSLDFGDSEKLVLGDKLMAVGQPLGFEAFVSEGTLAAKGNVLGSGLYNRFLLLNLPTHPANAGGPIVDRRGRVVAMATYIPKGPATLGFGLPSQLMIGAIRDILRHGKIVRPWIGIVARSVPNLDSIGEVYGAQQRSAVIVDNLIVDGPAAKAGLQVGDLIVAQGGKDLRNLVDLQDLLSSKKAGEVLKLKLFRRKQGYVTIDLLLGEIPSARDLPDNEDLL